MKSALKFISLIPIYFLLVVCNNIQNLIIDKNFINVDFVNLPTMIAFICVGIVILFWKKIESCRKFWASSAVVAVGCTLLNGYFGDKHIYKYFLLYLMLMYNTYIFSKIFKIRFELSIFSSNAVILLVAWILSMFNSLKWMLPILIAVQVIATIYIIINRKKMTSSLELGFNSVSVAIFGIMYLLFVLGGINRYVHTWDEYSHWAYDATVVAKTGLLSTQEGVTSATREYPPLLSIWHYFTSRIADFNEQHLYISLSIFMLIMSMPAFCIVDKKNKIVLPLFTIALFFTPGLFGVMYTNCTLYADYASAITYFVCFIIYLLFRDKDEKTKNKLLFLSMGIMVLIKPTGIVNAFVLFVIMALIDYMKINKNGINAKNILKDLIFLWKKYWKLGISVVSVFLIWQVYVKICNATIPMFYPKTLVPYSLQTGLSYKLNIVTIGKVLGGAIRSFDGTLILEYTFLQYIVAILIISMLAFKIDKEKEDNRWIPYFIGGMLYFLLTVLAIFVTFTLYEAENVASLGRYINNFNVALVLTLICYLCSKEFLKNKYSKILTLAVLLFIFTGCGISSITYYATDLKSRSETRDTSYKLQDKLAVYLENTPENSQVYILDQTDQTGIMAMWYARYYGFPRKTNATNKSINWKIRTSSNEWDLQDWGLTAQDLSDDLLKYNFEYLFLYSSTDEMFEQMKFMFEDYDTCKEYTLFKVEEKDGHALLVPVA